MSIFIRRSAQARCHNCGERVNPSAAGCWLCGAALDPQRWQRPAGAAERLAACWRALVRRPG
jgi:hypothetical protein